MESAWETREQLLAAAKAAGYPTSASQLGRLYRSGFIPAPEVRALGRGRGTESRYPPGTSARLLRVLEIRASEHRLTHAAWRLWWEDGGAILSPGRQVLTRAACVLEAQRNNLVELLAGEEAGEPAETAVIERLYSDVAYGRIRGPLAEARSNVGREQFATAVRALTEVAAGRFRSTATADKPDETAILVEQALGLGRARTDSLAGSEPWLTGDPGRTFSLLSEIVASRSFLELAETDNLQLDLARVEIQSLIATVGVAGQLLERLHGRGAFGYGLISRLLGAQSPHSQAIVLLGWLLLRSNGTLRSGLEQIGALAPQAEAAAQLYDLITLLRKEIPALAPVMSDERLAAAQRDESAARELNAGIARLRKADPESFDAFFAAHPETDRLIAVIDTGNNARAAQEHEIS